ncbi:MAG: DUF4321 domain-containing protein [candidate division WOR-3 bacterium]|nr:DUF4321 domain-containing protein [candidate division WOR-3 bacterium]
MRRSVGKIVLIIVVVAVIGAVLSYGLAGLFPSGPVYNLFFKVFSIGIKEFTLNLGFLSLTFGLSLSITGLTVLFIILALILLNKL